VTKQSEIGPLSLGYVCGAVRVTTNEHSEAIGPRAHVVGFLNGAEAAGISVKKYLVGDEAPRLVSAPGSERAMRSGPVARALVDVARLGLRYAVRRRAMQRIGEVEILYERQALFQDIGRAFQRRGTRWIVESNGPYWYETSKERNALALTGLAKRIELGVYRSADLVVAVSEPLKEIIVRETGRDPDDVFVLPNATDAVRFDPSRVVPKRLATGLVFGFVGYVTAWAGLDELLWAVSKARERGEDISAVIVGGGPQLPELRKQATALGIADHVVFTGNVPWSEVPALMAGFDVGLSGQRVMEIGAMYHSPQKLYEYQAMGLPVVASAHPDAVKLLGANDSGWLFGSGDRDALLEAVMAAARAGDLPARGERARVDLLAHHTWEVRVKQLITEIERRGLLRARAD
jgi:glycosyltransferase involved in cell wall biosynthesis